MTRERALTIIATGALLFLFVAANAHVHYVGSEHVAVSLDENESADAVLILGASVLRDGTLSPVLKERVDGAVSVYERVLRDGTLSPVLKERVDGAVSVYERVHADKIIVSGDSKSGEYDEVSSILAYIEDTYDISDSDILTDAKGFSTRSSIANARAVFGADSIIIPTQRFHIRRSLFIADSLGLNAVGVEVGSGNVSFSLWVRERLASVKAVFEAYIHW